MTVPPVSVHILPVLEDNYCFLVHGGGRAIVVDPGEAAPVLRWLAGSRCAITHILITHYDGDHIGGVAALRTPGIRVIGPEPSPFPLDVIVREGSASVAEFNVLVFDTPGHARPHVSYYWPTQGWLFTGDCLFGAGCGRAAPANLPALFSSILRLNELPGETMVYFGHEYTLSNLAFAASVEPGNPHITRRRAQVESWLRSGVASVPSTLEDERLTNPFLRTNSPEIRQGLGMSEAANLDVFIALRKAKNAFAG